MVTTTKQGSIYKHYVLIVLMITYVFSYMDRQILAILIEDIGREFALSDAERGLLLGVAFAIFYAGLGVPIAWLADRANRKNIIAVAITVWSTATALSAFTNNFGTLLAARMGVGVGEAGGTPPAHSLISDYFDQSELSRALAVYSLGPLFGGALGLAGGGMLADVYGWRATFVILGVPGIIMGMIVYLTIAEPVRCGSSPENSQESVKPLHRRSVWRSLASNDVYVGTVLAYSLQTILGAAVVSWTASILIRVFDTSKTDAGLMLGVGAIIGAVPGMLIGGVLADRLGPSNRRWLAWIPAIGLSIALPFYATAMFASSALQMVVLLSIGGFFIASSVAPSLVTIQSAVRPNERALGPGILLLMANLFGLGLGPLLAGGLSDWLEPTYGVRALSLAFASMTVLLMPAIAAYVWTGKKLTSLQASELD